jgi:hypothetical protein
MNCGTHTKVKRNCYKLSYLFGIFTLVSALTACNVDSAESANSNAINREPIATAPEISYANSTGTVGTPLSVTPTLNAQGEAISSCVISSGSLLGGLTINNSSCVISGTPSEAGTSTLSVAATNSAGTTTSSAFTITVNVPVLSISAAFTLITSGSSIAYTISNGVAPYSVSVDQGSVDNPSGSGIYSANGATGSATLIVTDAASSSAQVVLTLVNSSLSISTERPWVSSGNSLVYTVSGGTAPYNVIAGLGTVDNFSDSGNFSSTFVGNDTISVTDSDGITASLAVAVYNSPNISFAASSVNHGQGIAYTVSGGSGSYEVGVVDGNASNANGSGTYYANSCADCDITIEVLDLITQEWTSASIRVDGSNLPPLGIWFDSSSINFNDIVVYHVSGGTGSYSVSVDSGEIDGPSGSGWYTANGCSNCTVTIQVSDPNSGLQPATATLSVGN